MTMKDRLGDYFEYRNEFWLQYNKDQDELDQIEDQTSEFVISKRKELNQRHEEYLNTMYAFRREVMRETNTFNQKLNIIYDRKKRPKWQN